MSQMWQCTHVIPATWDNEQEDPKFKASAGNLVRPCPKIKRAEDVVSGTAPMDSIPSITKKS